MKNFYPVLVEKSDDGYVAKFPGLENLEIERIFNDTLDDVFEDARVALCEAFYKKEITGDFNFPKSLQIKNIVIPNSVYFCMLEIDTEWYRKEFIDISKFTSNPFV